MSPQEENARIFRSHSQIKPEFLHSGTFISELCDKVLRIVPVGTKNVPEPETEYLPGMCGRCWNSRETSIPIGYETGDYEMVPCPECAL